MIKIYFRIFISTTIVLVIYSCAGKSYKKMSIENPEELLSIQDSLLKMRKNDENILKILATANNRVARKHMNKGDYSSAINYYEKATDLTQTNIESKYGLLLAKGQVLVKKGNKNDIWNAIENYSKAAALFPKNGEPFYQIALAYTKLGDTDFDLILESYEKALSLELNDKLRVKAKKKHKHAQERKKKLELFWR